MHSRDRREIRSGFRNVFANGRDEQCSLRPDTIGPYDYASIQRRGAGRGRIVRDWYRRLRTEDTDTAWVDTVLPKILSHVAGSASRYRMAVESYVVNYTDLPSSKDIPAAKAHEEVLAGIANPRPERARWCRRPGQLLNF
jgi:hypothetical protein